MATTSDDPPIGEDAWLRLLKNPRAYAVWAEQRRKLWTAKRASVTPVTGAAQPPTNGSVEGRRAVQLRPTKRSNE